MAGSVEALRRFDSSFRYLHGKALGHFLHLGRKSLDILTRIQYSCINKSSCLVFSWVLSALPVQLPMPGCLPLIAAILMQKFPGSVKLTCPENQSFIRRRLEYWKHNDLAYQGYTYSLESNQTQCSQDCSQTPHILINRPGVAGAVLHTASSLID